MVTLRQKKAFKEVAENGGNLGKAMRKAGYAEVTSKSPVKLTDSLGWQELMEKYLPDNLLAEKHLKLLNKTEKIIKGTKILDTGEPETQAVSKGLEMAYKLKDKFQPTKIKLIDDLEEDDDQIRREVRRRIRADIDKPAKTKST